MPEVGEGLGGLLECWGREGGMAGVEKMYRFVHACPGTDDICASEFFACNLEHALQVLPISDICLLEDCSC